MLQIYKSPKFENPVSSLNNSNPVVWLMNTGTNKETILYLKSDSDIESADNGTITAVDLASLGLESYFEFAEDISGEPDTYSDTLSFSLAAAETLTFWLRASVPTDGVSIASVKILVSYTSIML